MSAGHGQKWSSTVEHGETWEMSVKIRSVEGVEAAVEVKVPQTVGTHSQNTALKESVVKLSLSKLFNLPPRGEQRKTQCCDKITVQSAATVE